MKIKFNPNIDVQQEATTSILDLFDGQEISSRIWPSNLKSHLGEKKGSGSHPKY